MKPFHRGILCAALLAALLPRTAGAQFTSVYPYVAVAGTFNDFNTFSTNMVLISNRVWQGYFQLPAYSASSLTNRFLFATRNFTNTWKEANQSDFSIPIAGTAEFNTGNDIVISNNAAGTFRFRLDEASYVYSIVDVSFTEGLGEPWINELHYDNASTDSNEGIEIAGQAGLSLTGFSLHLYNGGNGQQYGVTNLSGTIPNQNNGFGTLFFAYPVDGIQNGAPDGVALSKNGVLIQFISYEGMMTGVLGVADGVVSVDIGVSETGTTPAGQALQLTGTGNKYSDFNWSGPSTHSRGSVNSGQSFTAAGATASSLSLANLGTEPSSPSSNDTVHLVVDAYPTNGASNVSVVALYRVGSNGLFSVRPMAPSNTHWKTVTPIPAQPIGSVVQYYVSATWDGPGTNAPIRLPTTAPATAQEYGIGRLGSGGAWINEVDAFNGFFEVPAGDDGEFIELAGQAGSDISGWKVWLYNEDGINYAQFTLPAGSLLPNDSAGFGFYVLGDSGVTNVNLILTNASGAFGNIPETGGVQLRNEFGAIQQSLFFGTPAKATNLPGFTVIGGDEDFAFAQSFALGGTGGAYGSFTWAADASPSSGASNTVQTFTGGNTNPLPPSIVCPADVYFTCTNGVVPAPNTNAVTAYGLCGDLSVTVQHAGDTTNSGTGCLGSPRIITRTYRAISSCATTSTCQQLFVYEDTTGPVITGPTQALANADFESGTLGGWQVTGTLSNAADATTIDAQSGFAHGRIIDPTSSEAVDATGNGHDGRFYSVPVRGLSGVSTNTGTAIWFDGVDDRIDIPYDALLNTTQFSFSVWARAESITNAYRSVLASRGSAPIRGYTLYADTSNKWSFWTGDGVGWNQMPGPSVVTGIWIHLVGTYSNGTKRLYANGVQVAQSNNVGFAANTGYVTRVAAGEPETTNGQFYFKGTLDDLQIFDRTLASNEVAVLYNSGLGGPTGTGAEARLKLNELSTPTGTFVAVQQTLVAASGQTWNASGYLMVPGAEPLQGSNRAFLELQYLNAATGLLASATSQLVSALSPPNVYQRYSVSALAPSNAALVRLRIVYQHNTDAAGTIYFDNMALSPFAFDPGTNCYFTLTDMRPNLSASDNCTVTGLIQSPVVGSQLLVGDHAVTFKAYDQCGQSGSYTLMVSVVDVVAPKFIITNFTVACDTQVAGTTGGVSVTDCSSTTLELLSEIPTGGDGCPATPRYLTRVFRAIDAAGNVSVATQVVTQVSTNAPVISCSSTGSLANPSFETTTPLLDKWGTYGDNGPNLEVRTDKPFAPPGLRHVKIFGQFNGSDNYTGFYQDIPARVGQTWRASGWVYTATNDAISGRNEFYFKMEFLDANFQFLETHFSRPFNTNSPVGIYQLHGVQAVAPFGTARVRLVGEFAQRNDAGGSVFVDATALNMTTLSVGDGDCQAELPDLTGLPVLTTSNRCSTPTFSQSRPAGTLVNRGTTNITLTATDACGLSANCSVTLVILDDRPPTITSFPTNLLVATTNDVPPVNTNSVVATDPCGTVTIRHIGDLVTGGNGSAGNPMYITRTYRAQDNTLTNAVDRRQLITVESGVPPAPTNVYVAAMTLGTNIVLHSLGTNTWSVAAEYTTNLPIQPQIWLPMTPVTNSFAGGTNVTSFNPPVTSTAPVIIRIRQYYP